MTIQHNVYSSSSNRARVLQRVCHAALLALVIVSVLGCSRRYDDMPTFLPFSFGEYDNGSVGRFKTSYLAEQIDEYYRGVNPGPIGVTTFVNLDDLTASSSFGRMVGEQLMSELSMRGFDVVELRHSDALQFLDTSGEIALSRDVGFVRKERQLGGVIVGTYVVSPVRVYLNARLVDPSTSLVLSAGSVEMGKTREIGKLLRAGGIAPSLERIPVRHVGFSQYPANQFGGSRVKAYDLEEESRLFPAAAPQLAPSAPQPKKVASLDAPKIEVIEKSEGEGAAVSE
jgi:TolB-like protein